jgi:hypothetical protein
VKRGLCRAFLSLRGTKLGALDFKHFAGIETDPPTRMEEQYDAVLYTRYTINECGPPCPADDAQ